MLGLRVGKVIKIHYELNTVDVFLENGGGIMYNLPVISSLAGSSVGVVELPILKTLDKKGARVLLADSNSTPTENLFHLETLEPKKEDLDEPLMNYCYAVIGMTDEQYGKIQPVCLGFIYPERNQVLFNPDNPPKTVSESVQTAVKKLKGGLVHRTNSDVYWTVDMDGNYEWSHPNGSFIRIAESPALGESESLHVDLLNANNKSQEVDVKGEPTGNTTNSSWNTSLRKGLDGNTNASRKLYGHVEIVTENGIVLIDIDKQSGNIIIQTPKDISAASKDSNKLTIVCGGDAIIESVQGDVQLESVNGSVTVEAKSKVTLQSDGATRNSILLAPNSGGIDNLVFLHKLISKFNSHQHICNHTGSLGSAPNKSFDESDGTSVTSAG
jgi:hypothetical protein